MLKLKVLIIGAGLGGLCLAQALRKADIAVDIFERDGSPCERPQGYRLHVDADGASALAAALPYDLFELFDMTAMEPEPYTTVVDTAFEVRRRLPSDGPDQTFGSLTPMTHANVDRATLREILLGGLDHVIHFGEEFVSYTSDADGVTATFRSGRTVRGDLLVGADGIRSAVRRQRLPDAQIQDSGVRAIYGRIPMAEAVGCLPAQVLKDVFTVAVDERQFFLGLGPVAFPVRPDLASVAKQSTRLRRADSYVACIVGGRQEVSGRDDTALRALDSGGLQELSCELLRAWPAAARRIPSCADPSSFFPVEMFTSVPMLMAASANVTLLGDAVHAMTPTLGRGANLALRHARLLAHHLRRVATRATPLAQALAAYEAEMTAYGFDAVRKSAAAGARLMGQRPLPS
jgi:2-polyprenyl-6-methoxyphenol hydroxylase-like FAD-dependent oxidoreductase